MKKMKLSDVLILKEGPGDVKSAQDKWNDLDAKYGLKRREEVAQQGPQGKMGHIEISVKQMPHGPEYTASLSVPQAHVHLEFKGTSASEALMQLAQKMSNMGLWE